MDDYFGCWLCNVKFIICIYTNFDWKGNKIWAMMVLGGWVPIIFEAGGGVSSYLFYYKTLRLN